MSLSFLAAANAAPDRVALVENGVEHRFGDLATRVRAAATWLRARLDRHDCASVAFVARPRLDEIVLLYAAIEIGVPVVPLHPRLTEAERGRALSALGSVLFLDEVAVGDAMRGPAKFEAAPIPDDARPLAMLHTSGSSGTPKGVVLSRSAFASAAETSAAVLGWRDDDRWLLCLPFAHVGGLSVLTRCLIARRTVALSGDGSFSPGAVLDSLDRDRVTLASFVPAQLRRLLDEAPRSRPPSRLRAVLVGGAAASPALLAEAAARGWPVLATYGLTEACSQVATWRPGDERRAAGDCGPPLPGTSVRIADGEIQVRGPTLLSGYLPLGAHPSALTEDGWLATGDAGFLDDEGRLHIVGRRDRLIITGGENVAPIEVEDALESCPGVASACVFGLSDPKWGQVVAAALVPKGSPPPDDATLFRSLSASLAPFKRPRRIAWLPSLPALPSGKPDLAATVAAALPHLRPFPAESTEFTER